MVEVATSQLAFASPLAVAPASSPDVFAHVAPTVRFVAAEQLSFTGGAGGGGGGEFETFTYFLGV
jgi:hypothetical protein